MDSLEKRTSAASAGESVLQIGLTGIAAEEEDVILDRHAETEVRAETKIPIHNRCTGRQILTVQEFRLGDHDRRSKKQPFSGAGIEPASPDQGNTHNVITRSHGSADSGVYTQPESDARY